jgi:hypothetical protein
MKELFLNENVRALSWNQPYASLMLHGKIETRTYPTNVRGKVMICAAQKEYPYSTVMQISKSHQYDKMCAILESSFDTLPLGYPIAIGDIVDCRPMTKEDEDKCFVAYREPWEHISPKTGKKTTKRLYCWVFENVREIEPLFWKGKQGWAVLDEETKAKIKII